MYKCLNVYIFPPTPDFNTDHRVPQHLPKLVILAAPTHRSGLHIQSTACNFCQHSIKKRGNYIIQTSLIKGYLVTSQKLLFEDRKCFKIPSCDLKNTDISYRLFTLEKLGCGSNTNWSQQQGGNWLPWRTKPVLSRCRVPYKGPHEKRVWDSMISYTSMFLNLINNAERFCLNLHFTGSRKSHCCCLIPGNPEANVLTNVCLTVSAPWGKKLYLDPKWDLHQFRFLWWSRIKQRNRISEIEILV